MFFLQSMNQSFTNSHFEMRDLAFLKKAKITFLYSDHLMRKSENRIFMRICIGLPSVSIIPAFGRFSEHITVVEIGMCHAERHATFGVIALFSSRIGLIWV